MLASRSWGRFARELVVWCVFGISCGASLPAHGQAAFGSERPWFGVAMDTDTGMPGAGARVGHVVRGSPADRAGVRDGDRIVRIGSARVLRGGDVVQAVAKHAVGETVDVTFVRGTVEHTEHAALASFPSQDAMMRMDLVGAFAPPWKNVEGVSGSFPVSVTALRGHVLLIDFWATWCGPCRIVMPKLGALQARYGAQGLSVLGLSTEDAEDVAAFAQQAKVPYPIAVDKHAETTRAYGVSSLPTLVVIDKRGVVRDLAVGYDPSEDMRLEATVRSLLAEPAVTD